MSYHHLHYPSPSPFSNATLSPVRHGAAISVRPLSCFKSTTPDGDRFSPLYLQGLAKTLALNLRSYTSGYSRKSRCYGALDSDLTSKFTSKRNSLLKCLSSGGSPLFPSLSETKINTNKARGSTVWLQTHCFTGLKVEKQQRKRKKGQSRRLGRVCLQWWIETLYYFVFFMEFT